MGGGQAMRTGLNGARSWAVGGATLLLAGLAGTYAATWGRGDAFADCRGGQVAGGDLGGPLTLVDGDAATVTDAEIFAEPTLLYFGFTSCEDVCPLDMARNAAAAAILDDEGIAARPAFVSVDPARDTPEVVGAYAKGFAEDAIGLTGSAAQVATAARAWRVAYGAEPADANGDYEVNHSVITYLVLPGRGYVGLARTDETPEAVAERLGCFARAAGDA